MDNIGEFEKHFDAVRSILLPYKGNRIVDALPSTLFFVIQAHKVLPQADDKARSMLLRQLDSVTDMFGKVGEIVSSTDFEKLKSHYVEIQFLASQGKEQI